MYLKATNITKDTCTLDVRRRFSQKLWENVRKLSYYKTFKINNELFRDQSVSALEVSKGKLEGTGAYS